MEIEQSGLGFSLSLISTLYGDDRLPPCCVGAFVGVHDSDTSLVLKLKSHTPNSLWLSLICVDGTSAWP